MKANQLIEEVKKMCKERGLKLLDIKVSDDEGTSRHYVPKKPRKPKKSENDIRYIWPPLDYK
jgi:hypothetical protein